MKFKIITLIGSTKFKAEFTEVAKQLVLKGNIILTCHCFLHSGDMITEEQKIMLDEIHKRMIDLADEVYVINKDGYIGDSTANEIEYAMIYVERYGQRPVWNSNTETSLRRIL